MTAPAPPVVFKIIPDAIATIVLFMRKSTALFSTPSPLFACTSLLLLLCASFSHAQATPATGTRQMTDPAQVHASAIVIDTHADTPQRFVDEHWNFTDPLNGGMLNYDSAKKGNLDAQFFSIWVDPGQYAANASARRTLELIDGTLEQVRKAPNKLQLCTSADEI